MNTFEQFRQNMTRRYFFSQGSNVVGAAALASLMGEPARADVAGHQTGFNGAVPTHFPGKVKNVIYLHMVGGPSQLDLYDYKPQMNDWYDKDLPKSIRNDQRLTTMTSEQAQLDRKSVV